MTRARITLVIAGLLLCCGSAAAANKNDIGAKPLRDLHYGDVLYHYYQDQDFDALTELLAARAQNRPQASEADGELLMAGLLLSFGQTHDAIAGFEHALQSEVRADKRNEAWLSLARALHQSGANVEALAALHHIDAPLTDDLEATRQMLNGELLIDTGRFDEAADALKKWSGSRDWMPFAQYNLGVALIRAGRASEGEKQLDQVDQSSLQAEEQLALKDRANTALGYTHLRAKEWDAARGALQRVRLSGPSSNQALLGLGWAESGREHDRDALVPWMELAKRDTSDVYVQEALLAVPYAMARADAPTAAADQYQLAVNRYDQEIQRLNAVAAATTQPAFVDRLIEASKQQSDTKVDVGKPLAPLAQLPNAPEYRTLAALIASNEFQYGLQNARRLLFLKQHLFAWSQRIATLKTSAPPADWATQSSRIAKLSEACDRMLARQRSALQQQAAAELQHLQQRMRDYQNEARFAQARLFDRTSSAPLTGAQP
jgi:hypothetical protein